MKTKSSKKYTWIFFISIYTATCILVIFNLFIVVNTFVFLTINIIMPRTPVIKRHHFILDVESKNFKFTGFKLSL